MDRIDYSKFQKSLKRLEEQYENHRQSDEFLPMITREGIAESVVRRFAACYDCLWKVLKRHMIVDLGIAHPPNSPKLVFRLASEHRLLPSPVEQWLKYADVRIYTSHDYNGKKTIACLCFVPEFIDDSICLYGMLSGEENWRS